jgi:hypothetical protein
MIQNALTKTKYGGRLSFMRRLPLGASLLPRFALTSIRYGISKPNVSWTTRTLSQRRFQTTDLTSFDHEYDTIYALSTAQGRAAIAIIRISGPGWRDVSRASFPPVVLQFADCTRYTKHCVPIELLHSLEKLLCESSTIPPTRTTSSTQP